MFKCNEKGEALKLECWIKKLNKKEKEELILRDDDIEIGIVKYMRMKLSQFE